MQSEYGYDPRSGKYFVRQGNGDVVFLDYDPTKGAGLPGVPASKKKEAKPIIKDDASLYDEELYGHGLQEEREKESERISMDKNRALRLEYAAMERMMNERQRQAGMSGINQMRYDANHMPMQGFGYAHGGQVPRYESGGDQGYQGDFMPIGAGPRVIMIQSPEQKKKEEEKSLWQKIKDAATGIGAGVGTPVLAAWAMQKWGPDRDRDNTGKPAPAQPPQLGPKYDETLQNEIFPKAKNFSTPADRMRFLQHHSDMFSDIKGRDKNIYDAYRDYINKTPEGVTLESEPTDENKWVFNNDIHPRFERVRRADSMRQYNELIGNIDEPVMTHERPLSFLMDRFNQWEQRTYPNDVQGIKFNPEHYPRTYNEQYFGGILPTYRGNAFDPIRYLDDTGVPYYNPTETAAAAYGGSVPRYADGGSVSDITSRIRPSEGVMKLGRDLIAKYKNPNIQSFAKGGTLRNIDNYMAEKTGKWRYPIYGGGGLLTLYGGYKALPGGIKLGKFLKHKFDEWRARQQKEEAKPVDPTPAATAPQTPTPDPHMSPLIQSTSSQPELDSEFSMPDMPESEPSTFFQDEEMSSPHSIPNEQAQYSVHSEPPSEHPEPPVPPAWKAYEEDMNNIYHIGGADKEMLDNMLEAREIQYPGYTGLYNQYNQARIDHPSEFLSAAHGGAVPRYAQGGSAKKFARDAWGKVYGAGQKVGNKLSQFDDEMDRRVGPLRYPIYGAGVIGLEELIRRTAKYFWNKRKGNQGDEPSSSAPAGYRWSGSDSDSSSSSGGDQGELSTSGSTTSGGHPKHYVRPPEPTFSSDDYESSIGKNIPIQRKINPMSGVVETVPGTGVFVPGPVMKKKVTSTRDEVKRAHQNKDDWELEQRNAERDFNYDQSVRHANKVPKIKPPKSNLPNQIPLTIPDGPLPPDPGIDVDSLWGSADVESNFSSPPGSPRTLVRKSNQDFADEIARTYRDVNDLELPAGLPESTRPNRVRFAHPPRDVMEWPEKIEPAGSFKYQLFPADKEKFFKARIPTVRHTTDGPRANPHKVGDQGLVRGATTARMYDEATHTFIDRPIEAQYGVYVPSDKHYPGGIKKDAYGPGMPRRDLTEREPILYTGTMETWNDPARRNLFGLLGNSDSDEQYRGATEDDWQDYQDSIRADDIARNQAAIDKEMMIESSSPNLIIDPGERYQHSHQDRITKRGYFSRNPQGSGFTRQPYWDVHDENWFNPAKDSFVPATADMELVNEEGHDARTGKPIPKKIIDERTRPFKIYPPTPRPAQDNFISNRDIALKSLRDNAKSDIVSMSRRSPLLPYPPVAMTRAKYDQYGKAGKAQMIADTRQQAIDLLHGNSSLGSNTSVRPPLKGIFSPRFGGASAMPPIQRGPNEGIYKDTNTQTDDYFGNPIDLPQNAQHTFPKMWRSAQGQYDPNVGEARLRMNLRNGPDNLAIETPQFAQDPIDTGRAMELIKLKGHRGTNNPPQPGAELHTYHRPGQGAHHRHRMMGSDMDVYHRGTDFPANDDSSDGVLTPTSLEPIRQHGIDPELVRALAEQRRPADSVPDVPDVPDVPGAAYGGSVPRYAQGGQYGPLKGNDIYKKGQWNIPRSAEPIAGGALLTAASIPLIRGIHRMTKGLPFVKSHKFEDEYLNYRNEINNPFFQILDPDSQENFRQSALMQKGDRDFMTRFDDYNKWTEKNKDWLDKNFPDTPVNWIRSRRPANPIVTQMIDHGKLHHGDLPKTPSSSSIEFSDDEPHVHQDVLSTQSSTGLPPINYIPPPLAYGGRVPRYAFGGFSYDTSKDTRREGDRSSEPIFGKGSYTMGGTLRTDTYQPTNPLDYVHHQYQSAQKGAYGFPMSLATNVAPLGVSLYRPMVGASINAATNLMSGNLTGALMNTWPLFRGRKAAQAAGTSFFGTPGLLSNPSRLLNFDYRTPGGKANMINMGMMALPPALGVLSRVNQRPYNYNESLTNQMGSYY
jgi:hypothetical protein